MKKQEAAAFLANVNHETGGLVHIVEQNTANYPPTATGTSRTAARRARPRTTGVARSSCPGTSTTRPCGDALGLDLLNNPWLVQNDSAVAWKTGLWYWNTQSGPGTMTPHSAMVDQAGFGQTIRSINGSLECDGRNPAQVQSRVDAYNRFTSILGVSPGGNLYC